MTAQQINFIDPSLRVVRDWLGGRNIIAASVAMGVVVGGHWAYEQTMLSRLLKNAVAAAPVADPAGNAVTGPDESQLQEAQRNIARGERLMQAVAGLTDLPHDNARRLRSLISAMPDSLWLQELEFNGERGFRIAGGATDASSLTTFAQRLGALPAFHGTPLQIFKIDPRAAPERADAASTDTPPAIDERAPHYAFVLSSFDADAQR